LPRESRFQSSHVRDTVAVPKALFSKNPVRPRQEGSKAYQAYLPWLLNNTACSMVGWMRRRLVLTSFDGESVREIQQVVIHKENARNEFISSNTWP
jgi:hypothetical protein